MFKLVLEKVEEPEIKLPTFAGLPKKQESSRKTSISALLTMLKIYLVKAMIFPVVMYRCESWTIKKAERERVDAFELWCWRRFFRIPGLHGDPTSPS